VLAQSTGIWQCRMTLSAVRMEDNSGIAYKLKLFEPLRAAFAFVFKLEYLTGSAL